MYLKILCRGNNFLNGRFPHRNLKRFFLSNAYKCSEAWENRLDYPAFKKINFENLYFQLDQCFQANKRISVLDVDLFATSLKDHQHKNELEDILIKLRECPECVLLPERTAHAVIRLYTEIAPKEDLFNILSNRIEFGIFPNNYLTNMIMDKFLEEKDSVSAVKVAVLQMLQEDVEHPITKALALYCCYNYLNSSDVWAVQKLPEPDPHEEVEKVRVKYLRNPYFDDHFDIVCPNHLVGKTLWMFGISLGGTLGMSSQLVGLILHKKYEKSASLLEEAIKSNIKLYAEAVSMAKKFLAKTPKQIEQEENKEESEQPVNTDSTESIEVQNIDSGKSKVESLLEELNKSNLIDGKLLVEAENQVKEAIATNQEKDIALQCQLYKQWEKDRLDHIEEEIHKSQVEKLILEIDKTKQELKAEEEKLFYFDHEDELAIEIQKQEERMKSVVYYKPKKKERLEEVYIPPGVHQKDLV